MLFTAQGGQRGCRTPAFSSEQSIGPSSGSISQAKITVYSASARARTFSARRQILGGSGLGGSGLGEHSHRRFAGLGIAVRPRVFPALSQSPYPNFLSHAEESFVTQFCASASVAKPGTSISGRSGNLTMTRHPDPIFMGRGSNLILATDLANGGLRARCPWISGNAQQHVYPMGKMRPGLRLPQSSWHFEAEGFSAQRRSSLSSRSSRKY